jgi:hypothetical protein
MGSYVLIGMPSLIKIHRQQSHSISLLLIFFKTKRIGKKKVREEDGRRKVSEVRAKANPLPVREIKTK